MNRCQRERANSNSIRLVERDEVVGLDESLVEAVAQGERHIDHVGEELPAEEGPGSPQPEGGSPPACRWSTPRRTEPGLDARDQYHHTLKRPARLDILQDDDS